VSRDAEFEQHRRLVFGIAYDITGSVADAEDISQEVYLAWREVTEPVANPRAYLARMATHQALNATRAAKRRRESYVGPWLPDPLPTASDTRVSIPSPEDGVLTADEVSMAMMVVLQTLTEDERAAFILREVFGFEYGEIASALSATQPAVRQLVHRAREHVRSRRPRYEISASSHRQVVEQFLRAANTGDVQSLMTLVAPDVVLITDSGGKAPAARKPINGIEPVMRFLLSAARAGQITDAPEVIELNGRAALLYREPNGRLTTFQILVEDGLVKEIYVMRNPEKLRHVAWPVP
jgi:RNA polymerase sigma-70 factor (ECF subfamily)